jgi:hypothetical protein
MVKANTTAETSNGRPPVPPVYTEQRYDYAAGQAPALKAKAMEPPSPLLLRDSLVIVAINVHRAMATMSALDGQDRDMVKMPDATTGEDLPLATVLELLHAQASYLGSLTETLADHLDAHARLIRSCL